MNLKQGLVLYTINRLMIFGWPQDVCLEPIAETGVCVYVAYVTTEMVDLQDSVKTSEIILAVFWESFY